MSEGSYLADRIRSRCIEEGDCLLWQGALSVDGVPRFFMNGQSVSLRRLLWVERHGELSPKVRIGVKCRAQRCVEPKHLVIRHRSEDIKGLRRSPAFKAKIAATKRAKSRFTPELIASIRSSPLNNSALGRELGLNQAVIAKIRNHEVWKDYTSPMFGLGERAAK